LRPLLLLLLLLLLHLLLLLLRALQFTMKIGLFYDCSSMVTVL
jgi:hypothetical protein